MSRRSRAHTFEFFFWSAFAEERKACHKLLQIHHSVLIQIQQLKHPKVKRSAINILQFISKRRPPNEPVSKGRVVQILEAGLLQLTMIIYYYYYYCIETNPFLFLSLLCFLFRIKLIYYLLSYLLVFTR